MTTRGRGREMGFLAGTEIFDFADKIAGVAELPIDGGEANISDIIHLFEAIHDFFPDGGGGNFPAVLLFELLHDLIDRFFDQFGADGAFFTGFLEAEDEFAAVKGLVSSIAFDGAEVFPLNLFVCRESIVT